jgi:hypothetical protein
MNTVKVRREELLTKVRSNRDAHRELFLKAQEGYRKLVIEELDKMLADARDRRPIQRSVTLTEPSNHIKDYDRVVTMLEMSVDETITLDAHDFDRYVMDNWDWSRFALSTNTAYAAEVPSAPGKWRENQE